MKHDLWKRGISSLLTVVMLFSAVPMTAFAREPAEPVYLDEDPLSEELLTSGAFYLATSNARIEENAEGAYLLKVARGGEELPAAELQLNILDITAKYGKDYTIRLYDAAEKAEVPEDSKSVLEEILDNSDAITEENYTDGLVSGDDMTMEEAAELYDRDVADMQTYLERELQDKVDPEVDLDAEQMGGLLGETQVEEPVKAVETPEPDEVAALVEIDEPAELNELAESAEPAEAVEVEKAPTSLKELRQIATGTASDRQPMDGGNMLAQYTAQMLSELSTELESAYLAIPFAQGETEKYIEIIPKDNDEGDGERIFAATLVALSENAVISSASGVNVTIADDEAQEPAQVFLSRNEYSPENGFIQVVVTREGAINQMVTVKLVTADDTAQGYRDYSSVDTTVAFPYGVTERRVNIPVRSEYLEEDGAFTIALYEPVNCSIGQVGRARCVIPAGSQSFAMTQTQMENARLFSEEETADTELPFGEERMAVLSADATVNSIYTGSPINITSPYSSSVAHDGYAKSSGDQWIMQAKENFYDYDVVTSYWSVGDHYDYSGWQVNWKKSGGGGPGRCKVYCDAYSRNSNSWETVWSSGTSDSWDRTDNMFLKSDVLREFEIQLEGGGIVNKRIDVTVRSIKPILRPFEVSLKGAEPLTYLNEKGERVKGTALSGDLARAHETLLEGANQTGKGTAVKFSGDTISVKSDSPYAYISALKIVHPSNGNSATIATFPYGTQNASFKLTNDLLKSYLNYVEFANNGSNGKKGRFSVQAVLDYYDTEVTVRGDTRGQVTIHSNDKTEEKVEVIGEVYRLKNVNSGLYLYWNTPVFKSNVVSQRADGGNHLEWLLKKGEDGVRYIHTSQNTHYLDINGGSLFSKKNRGKMELKVSFAGVAKGERYQLKDCGNGEFAIMTGNSGYAKCVEVRDASTEAGAELWEAGYTGAAHQRWVLEFVREWTVPKPDEAFSYHKGDTIRLYQNLDEQYLSTHTATRIGMITKESANAKPVDALYLYDKGAGSNYYTFKNVYSEIEVYPAFDKNDNQLVVRVAKGDVDRFAQDKGIFKNYVDKVETSQYVDYILYDKGQCKEGTYYELAAYAKDQKADIASWKPATATVSYTQETFYYKANNEADENIITLSCKRADAQPYVLTGKAFYGNVPLNSNNEKSAWLPATQAYLNLGRFGGVTDETGKFITQGLLGVNGDSVIYQVNASGTTEYKTAQLSNRKTSTFGEGALAARAYEVSVGELRVPAQNLAGINVASVVTTNMQGVSGNTMSINDLITSYLVTVANNGLKYTDSDGKERTEKVTKVDLLIYDGQTNRLKTTIEGARETTASGDMSIWNGAATFKHGQNDKYAGGDVVYVQITTDRVVGNGKAVDENGNTVELDTLKQTVYAPVNTGITMVEENRVDPVTHDIKPETNMNFAKLPLIGSMNAVFNISKVSLSLSELPNGGQRLSIGYIAKTEEESEKDSTADDGVNHGLTDFKGAAAGIKSFGEGVKASGKSTMFMPSWGLYPIFGLYLDFGLKNVYYTEDVGHKLVFIGGGLYLGLTGNFRLTQYFIVGWMPFYLGVDGEMTAYNNAGIHVLNEDTATIDKISNEENAFQNGFMPDYCIQANAVIRAYAGMGLCGTLGVRGGIQLDGNYIFNPTIQYRYPDYHENGLYLSASVRVWVDAVMFSVPIPAYTIAEKRWGYYEDIANGDSADFPTPWSASLSAADGGETGGSQVFMKARTSKDSEWIGGKSQDGATLLSTFEEDGSKLIVDQSYDRADAQLLALGDGRVLLAFLDDEAARSDAERTVLKYSVYQNGLWSAPVTVQDDGAADFEPNLCDAGDKVLLTWISRAPGQAYTNETEYLKSLDVYAVTLDKETLTLGAVERLCTDAYYDAAPVGLYDEETGDMLVYYLKSEVKDTDSFENAVSPYRNESVIVYMLYDGASGRWVRDRYFENEIDDPADAEILVQQFGGQRFLASAIQEPDVEITDPVIADFDAISYNGLGLYTFTVDLDNNMDTDGDRELFVQVYDFQTHRTFQPIRVTNDNQAAARPQLVRSGEHTYLFWLQNNEDVRYIDVTDLIQNGINDDGTIKSEYDLAFGAVYFINSEGVEVQPTFGSYRAFVDGEDNLFITWLQPVKNEDGSDAQEIYASALIRNDPVDGSAGGADKDLDEETLRRAGTSWSEGVRLTHSGRFNDEVAFVALEGGRLLTVANQFDMDLTDEDYKVTNAQLVATTYRSVGSLEVSEVELSNDAPQVDETVEVTLKIKNAGLKPAKGYHVEVYEKRDGVEGTKLFEKDVIGTVTPSSTDLQSFEWEMPGTDEELVGLSLGVKVVENETTEVTRCDRAIEVKPSYEVRDYEITEKTDGFHITYRVANVGNMGSDSDRIVVKFNDLYHNTKGETYYLDDPLGAVGIGEEAAGEALLSIPDEHFKYGYTNAYIEVQDKDGKAVSNSETFAIGLDFPYHIVINGDEALTEIELKIGQSMELNGTYTPDEFYEGGEISYSAADGSVVAVEGNKLTGLKEGTTELVAMVVPYGGQKTISVHVSGQKTSGGGGGGTVRTAGAGTVWKNPFADVKETDWFYDDVKYAHQGGLFTGISETRFAPAEPMTRAMLVTVLYRVEGRPSLENEILGYPFEDVDAQSWYGDAVYWARLHGIVKGYSDERFAPEDQISREQIATILQRYARYKKQEGEKTGDLTAFRDASSVSDWAKAGVEWAVGAGLIKGKDDSRLDPLGNASRAEVAAILHRYLTKKH